MQASAVKIIVSPNSPGKGIGWGFIGGLVATAIMDLILICAFQLAGQSWSTCFSVVGDTLARLFSALESTNNVLLGVIGHYLIGPGLGTVFGAAARSMPALRGGSRKKAILFAVLYAEIVSQPLLALPPILLGMAASETLLWFGGSFAMHLIWGSVMGLVWSYSVQQAAGRNSDRLSAL